MRLTAAQIETIRQVARQNFEADASVWLFGSRADDFKRSGDVDLYVESSRRDTLEYAYIVARGFVSPVNFKKSCA